jgi:hypothetical protein
MVIQNPKKRREDIMIQLIIKNRIVDFPCSAGYAPKRYRKNADLTLYSTNEGTRGIPDVYAPFRKQAKIDVVLCCTHETDQFPSFLIWGVTYKQE